MRGAALSSTAAASVAEVDECFHTVAAVIDTVAGVSGVVAGVKAMVTGAPR